jgi:glycosyltransferase involved in cell wall biosynthesis
MRVAYVCADRGVPVFGKKGSSVHVQEVIRALLGRGAEVELVAARTGGDPPSGLEGMRVHKLPEPPDGDRAERERMALQANAALGLALTLRGPFDLVYERYSLWSYAAMEHAREQGVPGLLEVNAPLIEEQAEHRGLVDRARAEWVATRVLGAAAALLAVSDEVARYLESFPGAHGRIHVVPNGVNPGRFSGDIIPAFPRQAGTFTVGFVGTLKPWHGLPSLVAAFHLLYKRDPGTRLLVVGEGPLREDLERDLDTRGLLPAVRFTGAVDPSAIPRLLASMDAAVAPYSGEGSFYFSPLKVYEYMAAGLPVVVSKIGQLDGLIVDGANGLLCAPGDPSGLADALYTLRNDPGLRARLGRAARETVLRDHTWDTVAGRILGLAAPVPVLHTAGKE